MILLIANITLVLGALFGMYFIAQQNKIGFVIFVLVEMSMAYIGTETENYGLVAAAILYLSMNIYSYIKWSKLERNRAKSH